MTACSNQDSYYIKFAQMIEKAPPKEARSLISQAMLCAAVSNLLYDKHDMKNYDDYLTHYLRVSFIGVTVRHADLSYKSLDQLSCLNAHKAVSKQNLNQSEVCNVSKNPSEREIEIYNKALENHKDIYFNHRNSELRLLDMKLDSLKSNDDKKAYLFEHYSRNCSYQ